MATQYVDLDMSDTVDVTTTLGLVEGGTYLFQPQGGAVYLREEPFLAWGEGRMVVTEAA